LHRRVQQTGGKAPGDHTQGLDETEIPSGEGPGGLGERTGGRGEEARAARELIAALLGLVLPGRDGSGAVPQGAHVYLEASLGHDDQRGRGGRRECGRVARADGWDRTREAIQGTLAETGGPTEQGGVIGRVRTHAAHHLAESRAARRQVAGHGGLDHGQREGLAREQVGGHDPHAASTGTATCQGDRDVAKRGLAVADQLDDAASDRPAGESQYVSRTALAAGRISRNCMTLGSGRAEGRMVAGERNWNPGSQETGTMFRRRRVVMRPPPRPLFIPRRGGIGEGRWKNRAS
jgi:hypothetical protein